MKLRGSLLAGTAAVGFLAGSQASYAFGSDPYFAFAGGANFVAPMTLNSPTHPLDLYPRILDFTTGFVGSAAIGEHFGPNFRAEGELSFRTNLLNGVTVQGEGAAGLNSGSVAAFGIMANGWFDIPTGTMVTPYFGGGAGAAQINLQMDTTSGAPCACHDIDVNAAQWAFAYQLGAGLAVGLKSGAKITLDYRYFATSNFSVPFTDTGSGSLNNHGVATTNYAAQSIMVGLRIPIGGMPGAH